jgi:C_GCAxxG_C_C family probable redox protein
MVHDFYWKDDLNCAITTIKILADRYSIEINKQVLDGLICIPGAAKHGALCGLVTGTLLFIGIYGNEHNFSIEKISNTCFDYSEKFEKKFGSLHCSVLRPEGFKAENPPHLCEELTKRAVEFSIGFLDDSFIDDNNL